MQKTTCQDHTDPEGCILLRKGAVRLWYGRYLLFACGFRTELLLF